MLQQVLCVSRCSALGYILYFFVYQGLTHIFILSSEMWSRGLVQSHDHSHHVFAVEDGRRQDVPGRVFCEFIDEWAEVLALEDRRHMLQGLGLHDTWIKFTYIIILFVEHIVNPENYF